jgi:predicted TIM-barrel fold metal-dependent hydrolase
MGKVMDLFKSRGGASVKLHIKYNRTLILDPEITDSEAAALFAKYPDNPAPPRLTPGEFQRLQDNLCWHMMEMARDRGLPLIVHCGYSWPTHWGDPENMHNLFKTPRIRGLNVDLCHSGWPHHGGGMIMARTYRNCYFNLCWTPMLSAQLGRSILGQCIDMLPKNKILTGTDCGSTESMLGTVRHLRSELCAVLLEKIELGYFGLEVAKKSAKAILLDNALEFYNMKHEDIGVPEHELALAR